VGGRCEVRNAVVIVTTLSWVNGLRDRHEASLPVPRNLATLGGRTITAKLAMVLISILCNGNRSLLSVTGTLVSGINTARVNSVLCGQ
jgi:hypothetical protein